MLSNEEKEELINEIMSKINDKKKVLIEVCKEGVTLPVYANAGDAGMDIRAAEDVTLLPGETKVIPTGLKMVIPSGYEIQVRARSGLSLKTPLRIANGIGTIDEGYRGELGVILWNSSTSGDEVYTISEKENKHGIYEIKKGDRIAQIVLSKYETIDFEEISDVSKIEGNRGGGFGSSGVN